MKKILKKIILSLIQLIEKFEYRNMDLDENDIDKKIIDSIDISDEGISVLSHDGYHPVTHIHKTQPYQIYELVLDSGDKMECADNHIVFCENFEQKFVKDLTANDRVMTQNGLSNVKSVTKTGRKISMYDITVDSDDHSFYSNGILSHNTVTAAVFLIHSAIFNYDKNIGIAANKQATAIEIVDKIKEIMDRLPFFLKPGIKTNNQAMMEFDNGCRMIAQATTKRSFIGHTIHILYLDEFAHVEPHILNEFYENIMPTVSSMEDSKIVITSTPNGYNKYYDLWQGAVDGTNSFNPIRVDWWQVPGRDDAWREKMIHDCGGPDEFMRQFGNSFLSTGNTLLSPDSLAKLQQGRQKFVRKGLIEIEKNWDPEFDDLVFHPEFDVESFRDKNKRWVMSLDLSEGSGGDYSVMNLFEVRVKDTNIHKLYNDENADIKKSDFFQLYQVSRYKSNTINLETFAKLVYIISQNVISSDNIKIVCEYNTYGSEFIRLLQMVFGDKNNFDMSCILKYFHNNEATVRKYGLKVKADNKSINCIACKGYIATDNIIVTDTDTVSEFEVFSKIGNTFKASREHDDLAMSTVNVCTVFEHPLFNIIMEDILGLNQDVFDKYVEMKDNKFLNIYDNYENLGYNGTLRGDSDLYGCNITGRFFGNNGLYNK